MGIQTEIKKTIQSQMIGKVKGLGEIRNAWLPGESQTFRPQICGALGNTSASSTVSRLDGGAQPIIAAGLLV